MRGQQPEPRRNRADGGAGGVGGIQRAGGGSAVLAAIRPSMLRDAPAPLANHAAAIGNVAPIAAAGTPRSPAHSSARTMPNRAGASASSYAHASSGTNAASIAGSASAKSGDQDLERGVGTQPGRGTASACSPSAVQAAAKPRASGETAHERGEHGADRGHRVSHLQCEQARPGDLVDERRGAGCRVEEDEELPLGGHREVRRSKLSLRPL